jgi:hypothetical protein
MKSRRQIILDTVSDLATHFLYYDRKEDDALPVGAIEQAVEAGEITVQEITSHFERQFHGFGE